MKFKSRRGTFLTIFILALVVLMVFIIISAILNGSNTDGIISVVITGLTIWLVLWMYFGTSYEISDGKIHYKCGPIKGKIKVESIREIEVGKSMWTGLRPATATKGLIVKFNKFDEIYISPETNESFIEEILKLNKSIVIDKN